MRTSPPCPFAVAVCVVACLLVSAHPTAAAGPKRLLGYYAFWTKDRTPSYSAATIPYQKLTHICHAFLLVDTKADGSINARPGLVEPQLISRAHAAGVKVLISIGGASDEQKAAFATVARDETRRRTFARNVKQFCVDNGYDGVDIDWEVPEAPQDTEPCTLLMRALREEMPSPEWLISMAIPSNPPSWGTGFDVPKLAPIVDFINVMTYDMHGPWTNHAGHHSPLFQNQKDPSLEGSIQASVDLFEKQFQVPREKLNVGTGFYGYEFARASKLWASCGCADSTTSVDYGTYIKPRINKLGWSARVDKSAKAPYLLRAGGGFITYDDVRSTARKVTYALGERDLGGVFMWELAGDYDGRSQDLLDAMHRTFVRYNR